MQRTIVALFSLLFCVAPSVATAQTSPTSQPTAANPIHITSCNVVTEHSYLDFGSIGFKGHGYNFFKIVFTNSARVAAKRIRFQIDFSKSRYLDDIAGSFASGVSITQILRDHGTDVQALARPPSENTSTTQCNVLNVQFADGTAWSAASPQQ